VVFFFKQKTAYEVRLSLVGSEMCIRDSRDGVCVAMTCGVPTFRTSRDEVENDLGPRLAAAVESLRQMEIF